MDRSAAFRSPDNVLVICPLYISTVTCNAGGLDVRVQVCVPEDPEPEPPDPRKPAPPEPVLLIVTWACEQLAAPEIVACWLVMGNPHASYGGLVAVNVKFPALVDWPVMDEVKYPQPYSNVDAVPVMTKPFCASE